MAFDNKVLLMTAEGFENYVLMLNFYRYKLKFKTQTQEQLVNVPAIEMSSTFAALCKFRNTLGWA